MNSFWPRGNRFPIMFVNVVGSVELGNAGRSATKTKVGKDSKHNTDEAKLAVRMTLILLASDICACLLFACRGISRE